MARAWYQDDESADRWTTAVGITEYLAADFRFDLTFFGQCE